MARRSRVALSPPPGPVPLATLAFADRLALLFAARLDPETRAAVYATVAARSATGNESPAIIPSQPAE